MSDKFVICRSFFMDKRLPKANWIDIFLLTIGKRKRFRVNGDSMLPCLKNGDEVLVKHVIKPQVSDVILARHPYKKSVTILKRISEITKDGKYFVIGDNPNDSTDSRTFGTIPLDDILGKVEKRIN